MKKVFLLLLGSAVLLTACGSKKTVSNKKPVVDGVSLYEETALYTENDEGLMVWATQIGKGDKISIYVDSKKNVESKKAIRNGKTEQDVMYHVNVAEKGDYWTADFYVAANAKPGIILKPAYIFTDSDSSKATKDKFNKFSEREVVAITEDKGDFYRVSTRTATKLVTDVYVKKDTVDAHEADVEFFKTLNALLKSTKDNSSSDCAVLELLFKTYAPGKENTKLCAVATDALENIYMPALTAHYVEIGNMDACSILQSVIYDLESSQYNGNIDFDDDDDDYDFSDDDYDYDDDDDYDYDDDDDYDYDDDDDYDYDDDDYDDDDYDYDDEY